MNAFAPPLHIAQLPDMHVRVAREVAMDIRPLEDILAAHMIEPHEWDKMRVDPRFEEVLKALVAEWRGAKNTPDRLKVKAGVSLEESLTSFHQAMNNPEQPLNHRIEVAKFLAKIAGIGEQAGGPVAGGFSVTINMGGSSEPRTINARPAQVIEHEV